MVRAYWRCLLWDVDRYLNLSPMRKFCMSQTCTWVSYSLFQVSTIYENRMMCFKNPFHWFIDEGKQKWTVSWNANKVHACLWKHFLLRSDLPWEGLWDIRDGSYERMGLNGWSTACSITSACKHCQSNLIPEQKTQDEPLAFSRVKTKLYDLKLRMSCVRE